MLRSVLDNVFPILASVTLLMLVSCTPSEPAAPPEPTGTEEPAQPVPPQPAPPETAAEAEAALETFTACLAEAESRMGDTTCKDAAATLAKLGGPPLEAALKKLDDPTVSPHGKVLIVDAFQRQLHPATYPMMQAMTEVGKDPMTRVCATALLASMPDVSLVAFLIPLTDDEDPKVSFAALVGVTSATTSGDSEFRKRLINLYDAPDTNENMREHIAAALSKNPFKEDLPVLNKAIQNSQLQPMIRRDVASALGRIGDASSLEALTAAEVPENERDLQEAVDLSIAAIKERLQSEQGTDPNAMPITIKELPGPEGTTSAP